jgi:hypothetical protein
MKEERRRKANKKLYFNFMVAFVGMVILFSMLSGRMFRTPEFTLSLWEYRIGWITLISDWVMLCILVMYGSFELTVKIRKKRG